MKHKQNNGYEIPKDERAKDCGQPKNAINFRGEDAAFDRCRAARVLAHFGNP